MKETLTEITEARQRIIDNENLIASIQGHCEHPEETLYKQKGSNTGFFDASHDSYWIDYHCYVCDKMWTEYQ